jgi:hypothetical protein
MSILYRGKRYEFDSAHENKRKAVKRANLIREVGDNARVVREADDYAVYRREKR